MRFLAVVVAVVLIGYPPFLIYAMTVPVPRFRTGTSADFLTFAGTVLAIYGGVLSGVAVQWARSGNAWKRLRPVEVFKAGLWSALIVGAAVVVGAGVYGLVTEGSFERGVGNLWGLVLIFAALFGSLVSAGVALLFQSLRPAAAGG